MSLQEQWEGEAVDLKVEIKVLHTPEEEQKEVHTWAVARVTINGVIIPNVRVVNKPKEEGMISFFAYPRVKVREKYEDVVCLTKEQKKAIELAIREELTYQTFDRSTDISVTCMTLCKDKGKLRGVATVCINDIKVSGVRLFVSEEDQYYVRLPQYRTDDGSYKNLIDIEAYSGLSVLTSAMTQEYRRLLEVPIQGEEKEDGKSMKQGSEQKREKTR